MVVDRKADPAEEAVTTKKSWPAWRYGPNGQSQIFDNEDDVPPGWEDHPSKVGDAADEGPGSGAPAESPYKDDTDAEVVAKLKERKLDYNEKWPRAKLEKILLDADKKAK